MMRVSLAIVPAFLFAMRNAAAADGAPSSDHAPATQAQETESRAASGAREYDFRREVLGSSEAGLEAVSAVTLMPSLDYFVTDHLTLGGSIGLGLTTWNNGNEPAIFFSISPRIGYHFPIGDRISFWPQIQAAYGRGLAAYWDVKSESLGAAVPMIVELTPHFFVGAGPDYRFTKSLQNVGSSYNEFAGSMGVTSMVGGWI
jgi:long-subunit fatty acid transport protein